MEDNIPIVARMQAQIQQWEQIADDRVLFLRCYLMMTNNMFVALHQQEFRDPIWVNTLIHHFASYYLIALHTYEASPPAAPRAWQLAHTAASDVNLAAIRKLLVGVNAHINYDLVLTLVDLLRPEWAALSDHQRASRYQDYCFVNDVIGRTIDAVQDQILDPAMPMLDLIDTLMGPVDELLISQLLTGWREGVWRHAMHLLATSDRQEQDQLIAAIEQEVLAIGGFICGYRPAQ